MRLSLETVRLIAALVRHGKYEQPEGVPSAHLPHPLTHEGESQAVLLASVLAEAATEQRCRIDPTLDTSRMLRAFQTATLAARGLRAAFGADFTVEEFDALAERGLGAAANLTMAAIEDAVRRDPRCEPLPDGWKYESSFRLPFQGAESLLSAGERVARHLEARMAALSRTAPENTIKVFVGHGGAFRHAGVALGVLPLDRVAELSMWHCRPVLLERRRENEWVQVGGEWKVRKHPAHAND